MKISQEKLFKLNEVEFKIISLFIYDNLKVTIEDVLKEDSRFNKELNLTCSREKFINSLDKLRDLGYLSQLDNIVFANDLELV